MGGGRIIKDATATPNDVKQGKIFYNNDGRQVGDYNPPPFDIKSITFNAQKSTGSKTETVSSYSTDCFRVLNNGFYNTTGSIYINSISFYNSMDINFNVIIGVKISGKFYPFTLVKSNISGNKLIEFEERNPVPDLVFTQYKVFSTTTLNRDGYKKTTSVEIFYY